MKIIHTLLCCLAMLVSMPAMPQGQITRLGATTKPPAKQRPAQKPQHTAKPAKKPANPANKPVNSKPVSIPIYVETFTVNGVKFNMVQVEGGSFNMGSYNGYSCEQPVHTEDVSTFYIGQTEVTQALWNAVMGNNPSHFPDEMNPVENVSWNDCQEFVERLSQLTGRKFRLPNEAEWEYAARGGNRSRGYTCSGSDDMYSVAWSSGSCGSRTHPVAQKSANELGIYDMSGNVGEWTFDQYSRSYSEPRNSGHRVFRGGSWFSIDIKSYHVASRDHSAPDNRFNYVGLRLAL